MNGRIVEFDKAKCGCDFFPFTLANPHIYFRSIHSKHQLRHQGQSSEIIIVVAACLLHRNGLNMAQSMTLSSPVIFK